MAGPYIYKDVDKLEGTAKVGSKSCVALVQHYASTGVTSSWTEGTVVKGNDSLVAKGTAVATFVNGAYPNLSHGNHAAFYISQDKLGIRVMDQWTNDKGKPTVSSRTMRFKGKKEDGTFLDPSNNGDALSVIL